jgi:hypothetical protein
MAPRPSRQVRFGLASIALAAAALLPVESGRAQSAPSADGMRVAFRLDPQQVIVPMTITPGVTSRQQPQARVEEPLARYGFPVFDLPDSWSDLRPADVRSGDRWIIHVAEGARVVGVVEAIVGGNLGCNDAVGVRIRVTPEAADTFAALPARYFVAEPARNTPASTGGVRSGVRWLATRLTPESRARLESRLAALLERELPGVRAESEDDIARMTTGDRASQQRARRIRARDEALLRGAARITYDVQSFTLSPDAEPVYFVRAEWLVGGQQAFAAALWLRSAAFDVVQTNVRPASWLRMGEFQERVDREHLGQVLNVVDVDGDGWGEVVFAQGGYESICIAVLAYTRKGLQATGAEYSYGC